MESSEWQPANPVEQALAEALAAADQVRFATILGSAQLYVPQLAELDEPARVALAALLPTSEPYLLAFTSPQQLTDLLGSLVHGYQELPFPALRQRWPDPRLPLALNPGSPIAVFLPVDAVAHLASGARRLVSADELHQAVADHSLIEIRHACLRDLADPGQMPADGYPLRDDPPVNALEEALRAAAGGGAGEEFLECLLAATVVLPTATPVTGPPDLVDERFPWRLTGGSAAPAVPLFSSTAQLARVAGADTPWVEVAFLEVVAHWPDGDRALCFNPGAMTELILSEAELMTLVTELATVSAPAEP